MEKNKFYLIVIVFIVMVPAWACQVQNLTDQSRITERIELFQNEQSPGLRVAMGNMKMANKKYGLGTVNKAIEEYERRLCNSIEKEKIKVKVSKTDFKGYYLECSPMPRCLQQVEKIAQSVPGPRLSEQDSLPMRNASASNYREGYVKARIQESYPNAKGNLPEFIQKELDAGLKEAQRAGGNLQEQLTRNIDLLRSQGEEAVDPAFKRLVTGLDQLLETPFASANNIDKELDLALKGTNGQKVGKYQVSSAMTGDDLFVVIKDGDKIEKVIGVDARGLGTTNMLTRYEEFVKMQQTGGKITSMDDVFKLSQNGMKQADQMMESSFSSFNKILMEELGSDSPKSLEKKVQEAHLRYQELQKSDPKLMKMRSGFIAHCDGDRLEVMNRITAIHNQLKELEAKGIDEFYPTSCLGAKYLLLKH